MRKYCLLILFLIAVISLFSCQNTAFDQQIWLEYHSSDFTDRGNPRIYMIDDLMKNHLQRGMEKEDIIKMLGKPTSDTIGAYLPENKRPPDSLRMEKILEKSNAEIDRYTKLLNEWYKKNYKAAPMLMYHVGWSLMDPVFLKIRLDKENKAVDFWEKQG